MLLPRADLARDRLADELTQAGAEVVDVIAYRTIPETPEPGSDQDIYRMLLDRRIDAVTFASASAVRNFVDVLGRDQAADLLRTGGRRVHRAGDRRSGTSARYRDHRRARAVHDSDLVDALVEHFTPAHEPNLT